jgi:hypothetical protein
MFRLDAELAKAQANGKSKRKSVKRNRANKGGKVDVFQLSKVTRRTEGSANTPSARVSHLEAKAALYDKLLATAGTEGLEDEDGVLVDFLSKHQTSAFQATCVSGAQSSAECPESAQPTATTASAPVTLTDEFGRQRQVANGSHEHKLAQRASREANSLRTKLAQRRGGRSASGEEHC